MKRTVSFDPFDLVLESILPIIEYLTSHNVTPNTPTILIAFVTEPVMAKDLCIEVMGLE